ncbi:MAG: translation initiation factor [Candidatus Hydrogenedentes bacterium]|nr:translation initiation factor [Candidatus Hydrogenedentota bacterium]
MSRKNNRIDTSPPDAPLGDTPFGALAGLKADLPREPDPPAAPRAEILPDTRHPFQVARTRKGGWPVSFEKRAAGKLVTRIANVSGDGNALLKSLRKHCATGGVWKDGVVELQGDHRDKVAAWFDAHLA